MKRVCIVIILAPLASVAYADVIYDDQTYNYYDTYAEISISSGEGRKAADDFEVEGFYVLESIRVWVTAWAPADMLVEVFDNSGTGPGDEVLYT